MMEYSDIILDLETLQGITGRFQMSMVDGTTRDIGFYFDGPTRALTLTGGDEYDRTVLANVFWKSWHADALEAYLAHRDMVRDGDIQTVSPLQYVDGLNWAYNHVGAN